MVGSRTRDSIRGVGHSVPDEGLVRSSARCKSAAGAVMTRPVQRIGWRGARRLPSDTFARATCVFISNTQRHFNVPVARRAAPCGQPRPNSSWAGQPLTKIIHGCVRGGTPSRRVRPTLDIAISHERRNRVLMSARSRARGGARVCARALENVCWPVVTPAPRAATCMTHLASNATGICKSGSLFPARARDDATACSSGAEHFWGRR